MQMPKMLRFDVWLNGKRLCRAGSPGDGVLTTILHWVRRDPAELPRGRSRRGWVDGTIALDVGGLFGKEHVDWVSNRRLRAGDTIRVRIGHARHADRPVRRRLVDPGSLASKRQELRNLVANVKAVRAQIRNLSRAAARA